MSSPSFARGRSSRFFEALARKKKRHRGSAPEWEHVERLEEAVELRGAPRQEGRRALEGAVKREAVRVASFLVVEGEKKEDVAQALSITRRTLLNWEHRGDKRLPLRGRPRTALHSRTRTAIIKRMMRWGRPSVSSP